RNWLFPNLLDEALTIRRTNSGHNLARECTPPEPKSIKWILLAMRKIVHIDMDAFYASVEQRDDPKLRESPSSWAGAAIARSFVPPRTRRGGLACVRRCPQPAPVSSVQARCSCLRIFLATALFLVRLAKSSNVIPIWLSLCLSTKPISMFRQIQTVCPQQTSEAARSVNRFT